MVPFCCLSFFLLSLSFVFLSQFSNFANAQAQALDYPTVTLSTRWTNNGDYFQCKSSHSSAELLIMRVMTDDASIEVVWSTNRNNPVKINATLELTSKGDLVLKDADGTIAWSTNTSSKSVVGLNLTDLGNLVLFDKNNVTVWQSFDHPIDTLVLGQKLMAGQRLMPSVSETNWAIDGTLTLYMNGRGLFAQIETSPPQIYYQSLIDNPNANTESPYVEFVNGSLAFFSNSIQNLSLILVPHASFVQYMKLGSDGHLRVYQLSYKLGWSSTAARFIWSSPDYMCAMWEEVADLLTMSLAGDCGYPKVCGQYGIYSDGQCSCPTLSEGMSYFRLVNYTKPNFGCSKNIPLSCEASQDQSFLELKDVTYFTLTSNLMNIDASSCKEACAKNCSCEAAIFKY
ncbi:hypothetical protein EUGRSUZ_K01186 [Eucalyptus grandis]|uniref:Uncharacterized protein n=2 Tax=Eucalyptus grandis TaxID=71139 RepID=A0ACC3IU86_EUCGR|nr:hypothetical protein EUGRSUZ_K01186 [Eucalyptus grandis]